MRDLVRARVRLPYMATIGKERLVHVRLTQMRENNKPKSRISKYYDAYFRRINEIKTQRNLRTMETVVIINTSKEASARKISQIEVFIGPWKE